MTVDDLRQKMLMTEPETKEDFLRSIGATNYANESILEMFRDGPWEPRICEYFKVPTGNDLVGMATIEAAKYQKQSSYIALGAALIAVISLGVSMFALTK